MEPYYPDCFGRNGSAWSDSDCERAAQYLAEQSEAGAFDDIARVFHGYDGGIAEPAKRLLPMIRAIRRPFDPVAVPFSGWFSTFHAIGQTKCEPVRPDCLNEPWKQWAGSDKRAVDVYLSKSDSGRTDDPPMARFASILIKLAVAYLIHVRILNDRKLDGVRALATEVETKLKSILAEDADKVLKWAEFDPARSSFEFWCCQNFITCLR